ncbi:MAG: hypothetical protein PVI26_02630, partial [Chitinispirillia bacterium]
MKLLKLLIFISICSILFYFQCDEQLTEPERIATSPTANAGLDVECGVNDSVPLHGTGLDNGTIVEYAWKFPNSPLWVVTSTGDTTIIAPSSQQHYICSLRVKDDDNLIGKDYVVIKVKQYVPRCEAGIDTVVGLNDPVFLHGTARDETMITEFAWKIGDNLIWTPVSFTSITDSFGTVLQYVCDTTIYTPPSPQEIICSLRVRDDDNNLSYARKIVNVLNSPPFVNVGPTISASAGSKLTLKASGSDNDSITTWEWKLGTDPWKKVTPSSATTCDTTIILPIQQQLYICSLRVTDVDYEKAYAVKMINIQASDLYVNAGQNIYTGLNNKVELKGTGGGTNPPFIYSWKINNRPWIMTNKDTSIISSSIEEVWICSLSIQDAGGEKAFDAMTIHTKSSPPWAKADANPKKAPFNYPVKLTGLGEDEEGIREYHWKCGANGFWRQASKDTVITTPSVAGIYRCSLKVVDNDWELGHDFVDIFVVNTSLIAEAGNDSVVGYSINHTLQGKVYPPNTQVAEWWWKIGQNGIWRRTSKGDTTFLTPDYRTTIVCSLKIVSTSGEIGLDEKNLFIKDVGGQEIVYSRGNNNNPYIYLNDSKFTDERTITRGADPKFSPDGKYIAFYRAENNRYYIYRMDWNGQNVRRLDAAIDGINPSWYSDSRHIAYQKIINRRWVIYRINIDNTNDQQIIAVGNERTEEPAVNLLNSDEICFFYNQGNNANTRQIYFHNSSGNSRVLEYNDYYRYNLEFFGTSLLWTSR